MQEQSKSQDDELRPQDAVDISVESVDAYAYDDGKVSEIIVQCSSILQRGEGQLSPFYYSQISTVAIDEIATHALVSAADGEE